MGQRHDWLIDWLRLFLPVGGGPAFGFRLETGLFQVSMIFLCSASQNRRATLIWAQPLQNWFVTFMSSRIISSPLPRITSIGLFFPYDGDCVCFLFRPLLKHLHSASSSDAVSLHGSWESACHFPRLNYSTFVKFFLVYSSFCDRVWSKPRWTRGNGLCHLSFALFFTRFVTSHINCALI